jgi:hypothetical protein
MSVTAEVESSNDGVRLRLSPSHWALRRRDLLGPSQSVTDSLAPDHPLLFPNSPNLCRFAGAALLIHRKASRSRHSAVPRARSPRALFCRRHNGTLFLAFLVPGIGASSPYCGCLWPTARGCFLRFT